MPRGDIQLLFEPRTVEVDELPARASTYFAPAEMDVLWHGEKYPGGFGPTKYIFKDYWSLRARSSQLFEQNMYARGIIRRLVTNTINTGLELECAPEEAMVGEEEGSRDEWSEEIENRFRIWARSPQMCDTRRLRGFGRIQAAVYQEALISGDVLVTLVQDRRTGLPSVQLIDGAAVQSPLPHKPRAGNEIVEGVEMDSQGRHVAYWVYQDDQTWKRLPAWGERSGRRLAWLVYGCERREFEVRGTPMLTLVLQSLQEIDRYRDSTQRKAVINSMLAMFIQKDEERLGSRPLTGGAVRRGISQVDTVDGPRSFNVIGQLPGAVVDELQYGEKPVAMNSQGTDEKFADFEEAIVQAVAWHFETPPEIMRLAFSANYSASQAAINEFKMYLNRVRAEFGEAFCKPVYQEWLIAQALTGRIQASEILQAWRDPSQYDVFGALVASEWAGHIKPSTDLIKQAKGYELLLQHGLITYDLASKDLTGTKFSKNVKKQRVEREQLAELHEILAAPEREAMHQNAMELAESKDSEDDSLNGGANEGATAAEGWINVPYIDPNGITVTNRYRDSVSEDKDVAT